MPWYPRSLGVSKPTTPCTPEAAAAAGRTDSRTERTQRATHQQPPRIAATARDQTPRTDASEGARSPRRLRADPAGGLARGLLTAFSAPRLREGARGRRSPGSPAARTRHSTAARPPLPHQRVKVRERLSARRPDSGTEPAKGEAGRGGAGRLLGGRGGAEGAGGRADPPRGGTCSAPWGGWTGEGSPAAGPASPRRTMGTHFYLPIATSREVAALGVGAFSSLRTKRGRGTPGSKRDPGVLAPGYPRTKGLRLQRRHLH